MHVDITHKDTGEALSIGHDGSIEIDERTNSNPNLADLIDKTLYGDLAKSLKEIWSEIKRWKSVKVNDTEYEIPWSRLEISCSLYWDQSS